uniref:Uncharacterized protein n=1 Tax=Chromera velia CCMP2878 TaxID=1169474 RepID=A0A0G4I565_9ALVE|eukprot:Cvel_11105.t1-p1 / transcript=Cvel_11105.t1 / gene=Cvel_11105 / organism=Chromera_velia_CCMP2878 / gene_product=hypothetical protein / transcript_product=hypothetical protein / location=Cvel_scaffold687:28708-29001(+) / protein_length=98 / sequence_SO=supercontig / SO=protein_coding / is_pseudo=false
MCGVEQLVGGQQGAIKVAIHAVGEDMDRAAGDDPHLAFGLLEVDASNGFGEAGRIAGLWNIRVKWPRAAQFIFNCYRGDAKMFLRGKNRTTVLQSNQE